MIYRYLTFFIKWNSTSTLAIINGENSEGQSLDNWKLKKFKVTEELKIS